MEIVSQSSDEELARRRALERIDWPLRELAANILRVTRGAGSPSLLGRQMATVFAAFEDYRNIVGCYPSDFEISEVLSIRHYHEGKPSDDLTDAVDKMVQGALQIAASRVIGQRSQEAAGDNELFEGLRKAEAFRAENRRLFGRGRKKGPALR